MPRSRARRLSVSNHFAASMDLFDTLNAKDFLREIEDLAAQLRNDVVAHQLRLDNSPKAIRARRKRVLSGDFRFFAYTYFPHHIRGESSTFQAFFCERFPELLMRPGGMREWFKAPRGEAKSSLLTKIGPVFIATLALLHRKEIRDELGLPEPATSLDYGIIFGAESRVPAKLVEVVKAELTANASLALDFPEVVGRTDTWKIGEIVTATGVRIESLGAEQAVRGTFHGSSRPSWLFGDDLITDAEAKSQAERNKRWEWFERALEYLGPPDGSVKILVAATQLHRDDPVSRAEKTLGHQVHHFRAVESLPERMDLWEQCVALMQNDDRDYAMAEADAGRVADTQSYPSYRFYLENREAMEDGAVTSWPSVRSLYTLMRMRAKNRRSFNTEMQGVANDEENKVFRQVTGFPEILRHWEMVGSCDPSMGATEQSDPSALLAGAYDREHGILHVIDARIKRRVPSKLEADLVAFQQLHQCLAIGFENNNAYEHSRQTFVSAGLRQGVALPLVGITASVPQEVRIESLEPFITDALAPRIKIASNLTQLHEELETWPEKQSGHHYDGLTALYILWALAITRHTRMEFMSDRQFLREMAERGEDDDFDYGGSPVGY